MQQELHDGQSIKTSSYIVQHNTGAFGEAFQLADRWRLDDVKPSKKYKARQKRFPRDWGCHQGNELSGYFVDHDKLWIFRGRGARNPRSCWDADQYYEYNQSYCGPGLDIGRNPMCEQPPA